VTGTICGVDVASKSLEARIGQQGMGGSFANTAEGIAAVAAFCQSHQVELVAMEASGGYEQQAFAQLSEQGLSVAILNPRAVRQFAQSMGRLEKTDRIDAGMIAWYAEVKKSQPARTWPTCCGGAVRRCRCRCRCAMLCHATRRNFLKERKSCWRTALRMAAGSSSR